jgi:preprotein translocase subunit SecF
MMDDDEIKATAARLSAETGRSEEGMRSLLRRLERPYPPSPEEYEQEAEQRQQALREIEERQRAEQEAEDAARPSILERAAEAVGTSIAATLGIAIVLALALVGLYVFLRFVKWAWTG